jgi:hypothetical protein
MGLNEEAISMRSSFPHLIRLEGWATKREFGIPSIDSEGIFHISERTLERFIKHELTGRELAEQCVLDEAKYQGELAMG